MSKSKWTKSNHKNNFIMHSQVIVVGGEKQKLWVFLNPLSKILSFGRESNSISESYFVRNGEPAGYQLNGNKYASWPLYSNIVEKGIAHYFDMLGFNVPHLQGPLLYFFGCMKPLSERSGQ